MLQFRDLTANTMNKLVRIPGIVISASVLSARATKLHLQCRACRSTRIIYPPGGLGGLGSGSSDRGLPRTCDAPELESQKKDCPIDPYLIIHSKSTFADQQTLKLQEAPDMVPVGELPRHMLLSADRYLTGRVVPGSRIIATGIYSTFQSAKNVSAHSLRTTLAANLHILYFTCRNQLVLQHSANRTFALSTSRCPGQLQMVLVVQIHSVYSSPQRRRKSLVRWPGVRDFTSGSQKVWARAYTGASVIPFFVLSISCF